MAFDANWTVTPCKSCRVGSLDSHTHTHITAYTHDHIHTSLHTHMTIYIHTHT